MLLDPAADAPRGAEQVFEELYDPAFLIDPEEGRFIGANMAASTLLGYDPDELRQLTPADIHPHEIPRLDAFLDAVTRHSRWSTDELACRCKDGGLIPAQVRASLVTLDGHSYILAIVRDRREEQLAELGRSIRKLTHDLRNTMVASRMMGDRLKHHEDPMVQRSAELISRSVNRAVRMCEAALSAGTSEEHAPQRERFALGDVVDEVIAALGPEHSAQATLTADSIEGINLDADFDQTFRILMNLARNALAAGAQHIDIAAERDQNGVTINVADDGPGLPDSVQRQLFSEKTAPGTRTGAGLGLAIAWDLASNHGGGIDLRRTGPDGTVFRVWIPDPAAGAG